MQTSLSRQEARKRQFLLPGVNIERLERRTLLSAYALHTLASFDKGAGGFWNAEGPSLVQDSSGDTFGLISQVGSTGHNGIFELVKGSSTPTLAAEIVHNGTVPNPVVGGLVMDKNGNIFASMSFTGDSSGDGVIFELPAGSHTTMTVAQFNGAGTGSAPDGYVIIDGSGNLFGTARTGGANNAGTVWELPAGSSTITTLASFPAGVGTGTPNGVVMDANGNFFGAIGTNAGNTTSANYGSIWELSKGSSTVNTLATFNGTNGSNPFSPLYVDANGNILGETEFGGTGFTSGNNNSGDGTIFEVPNGSETIHTVALFGPTVGTDPVQGVTADSAGDLFGVTTGGTGGVWELAKGSSKVTQLTTLASAAPYEGLLLDSGGNLFGTTMQGGTSNVGTVFELTPGGGGSSSLTAALSGKLPSSVIAGQKVNIAQSATVTDTGGAAVSGSVAAKLFLATGTSIDSASIQLASTGKSVKLKPHAHIVFSFKVPSLPSSVPNGTYHLVVQIIDPAGGTTDASSGGTITVAPPQIDLSGTFSKQPVAGKNGKTVLTFTVSNAGNTAAAGTLPFNIGSSTDGLLDDATVITSATKKINVKPGKSIKLTEPLTLPAGIYFVIIQLDPANTLHDVNLANNVFVTSGKVTAS